MAMTFCSFCVYSGENVGTANNNVIIQAIQETWVKYNK